ncbi:CSLA7 [Symbiodinium sp. CCMP2456]|nr:CSLA7 [Symbiodinium sp. CCMP2456]
MLPLHFSFVFSVVSAAWGTEHLQTPKCSVLDCDDQGGVGLLQSTAVHVKPPRPGWDDLREVPEVEDSGVWRIPPFGNHAMIMFKHRPRWHRPTVVEAKYKSHGPALAVLRSAASLGVILSSTAFLIPGCGLVLCACACCFARRRSPASPSPNASDGGTARESASRDAEAVQAGLWPARSAVARSDLVTLVCLVDILGNIPLLFLLSGPKDSGTFALPGNLERDKLLSMMLETLSFAIFLLVFGRWEQQRHLVTLWQTLQSLRYFLIRRSLFASPWMFLGVAFLLPLVSVVGMVCEISVDHPLRLPPFLPKKMDPYAADGWLGPRISYQIQSKYMRGFVTAVCMAAYSTRVFLVLYVFSAGPQRDLEYVSDQDFSHLVCIAIVVQIASFLPTSIAQTQAVPLNMAQWWSQVQFPQAYRTGPFEAPCLAGEMDEASELQARLASHQCRSITVVIPAYMPNEEDILMDSLAAYRTEQSKYPGEFRLILVWNSPDEHPEMEEMLEQLQKEWPELSVHRNRLSTTKCDNLNMAIEMLETDFALFNDMDTMVSAATMCRASLHLFEENFDTAQCYLVHCWEDFAGLQDAGYFVCGPLITAYDSVLGGFQEVYGSLSLPFCNGRGSFWRTNAIKETGFDHRTLSEDHDAMYRAAAFHGFKGVLDTNMLAQERVPPSLSSLVSQRVRWESGQMQKTQALSWVARSKHISLLKKMMILNADWCEKPFQGSPFIVWQVLAAIVMIARPNMLNPMLRLDIAGLTVNLPVIVLGLIVLPMSLKWATALLTSRYRPRWLAWVLQSFVLPFTYHVMRATIVNCKTLHNSLWTGRLDFVCTARDRTPSNSPTKLPFHT